MKVPFLGAKQISKSHSHVPHLLQLLKSPGSSGLMNHPEALIPQARGSASLLPDHILPSHKWDVRDLASGFKTQDFYLSTPMVSTSASHAEVLFFFPTTTL